MTAAGGLLGPALASSHVAVPRGLDESTGRGPEGNEAPALGTASEGCPAPPAPGRA